MRALVLVPTKELGQQVQNMMRKLAAFCSRDVRVADISGKADLSAQRSVCSGGLVVLWYRVEEDPVIKSVADVVFEQADLNGEA